MDSLSNFLNNPITIGGKTISKRLFLAPMAGLGHIAFRELLSEFGGYGLMFMEMCSARAVPQENPKTSNVFRWRDEELDTLVCQLFGSTPEMMAKAAKRVEKENFFGVDINFGCSVAAICKQNSGAALLKDPDLAVKIVSAVREAVDLPLFVKFRIGWKDDPEFVVNLSKRFQDAGADALTFHPRVSPDRRSRDPKWEYIKYVKDSVSIPVFGNGNVFDADDAEKMIEKTGCDGISLGRIGVAKPWIFSKFTEGKIPDDATFRETPLRMARLLMEHNEPAYAFRLFKKFAVYFCANFTYGHTIYPKLCKAENMEGIIENIETLFSTIPSTTERPNMNMFVG